MLKNMRNSVVLKILFFAKCVVLLYVAVFIFQYTRDASALRSERIAMVTAQSRSTMKYLNNLTATDGMSVNSLTTTINDVSVTDTPKNETREMVYAERRRLVSEGCEQLGDRFKGEPNLGRILVDGKHRVMYCQVPKVGCSNWLRVFLYMTGNYSLEEHIPWSEVARIERYYKRLSQYRGDDWIHMTSPGNYTKFVFVRHPFSRLLSAFLNKFVNRPTESQVVELLETIHNVTGSTAKEMNFPDFVQYLIMTDEKPETWNNHYRPMYYLCSPCDVKYDIIGHLETIDRDAPHVLKILGANFDFPNNNPTATNSSSSDRIRKYFSLLTKQQIVQLYSIYEMDFVLFGYKIPDYLEVDVE